MIKFFRKIRQKLVNEGKTSRYFKYALGEILLVVIGILMAVQINTWNVNRINSQKEQKHLESFKKDVISQKKALIVRVHFFNEVIDVGESMLSDYQRFKSLIKIDSLNSKLSRLMYATHFPETNTTFTELVATGEINLIRNETLKSSIIAYYQMNSKNVSSLNSNIENVFYGQIFPDIKSGVIINFKDFSFDSSPIEMDRYPEQMKGLVLQNLSKVEMEFKIVNAISLYLIMANSNRSLLQSNIEMADLLLTEIESQIHD